MALQGDAHFTRRRVPDPDDPIGAGGSEPGAVGAEREGMDRTSVAPKRANLIAGRTDSRNGSFVRRSRRPGICPAGAWITWGGAPPPVASTLPSGLKATLASPSLRSESTSGCRLAARSQIRTFRSVPAVARRVPW